MRKINEENERIKRRYLQYLKTAMRKDMSTVQKAAEGILRFEASTGFANFKRFHIEQVIKFRDRVNSEVSKTTKKPLAKSTVSSILAANKGFIFWLADPDGSRAGFFCATPKSYFVTCGLTCSTNTASTIYRTY